MFKISDNSDIGNDNIKLLANNIICTDILNLDLRYMLKFMLKIFCGKHTKVNGAL